MHGQQNIKMYLNIFTPLPPNCILMKYPLIILWVKCNGIEYENGHEDMFNYGPVLKTKLSSFKGQDCNSVYN